MRSNRIREILGALATLAFLVGIFVLPPKAMDALGIAGVIWLAYGFLRSIGDGLKRQRQMQQSLENLFRYANHQYIELAGLRREIEALRREHRLK